MMMGGWDAEQRGRKVRVASGIAAEKAYNNKVGGGGQSEVERSTLTREKATHREIKDGRGCQR